MNKKILSFALAFALAMSVGCGGDSSENTPTAKGEAPSQNLYAATINSLVATDALGRSFGESNVYASDKDVGVFYSVWHSDHISPAGILDITDLIENNPEELWDISVNTGYAHYWGEPL